MTTPSFTRKDAQVDRGEESQAGGESTESGAEKRLGDLIRREDRSRCEPDATHELRRRACPSGE